MASSGVRRLAMNQKGGKLLMTRGTKIAPKKGGGGYGGGGKKGIRKLQTKK